MWKLVDYWRNTPEAVWGGLQMTSMAANLTSSLPDTREDSRRVTGSCTWIALYLQAAYTSSTPWLQSVEFLSSSISTSPALGSLVRVVGNQYSFTLFLWATILGYKHYNTIFLCIFTQTNNTELIPDTIEWCIESFPYFLLLNTDNIIILNTFVLI